MELDSQTGEGLYNVNAILAVAIRDKEIVYRVRWEGFGPDADTWEPEENFTKPGSKEMKATLREFKKKNKKRIIFLTKRLNEAQRSLLVPNFIYENNDEKVSNEEESTNNEESDAEKSTSEADEGKCVTRTKRKEARKRKDRLTAGLDLRQTPIKKSKNTTHNLSRSSTMQHEDTNIDEQNHEQFQSENKPDNSVEEQMDVDEDPNKTPKAKKTKRRPIATEKSAEKTRILSPRNATTPTNTRALRSSERKVVKNTDRNTEDIEKVHIKIEEIPAKTTESTLIKPLTTEKSTNRSRKSLAASFTNVTSRLLRSNSKGKLNEKVGQQLDEKTPDKPKEAIQPNSSDKKVGQSDKVFEASSEILTIGQGETEAKKSGLDVSQKKNEGIISSNASQSIDLSVDASTHKLLIVVKKKNKEVEKLQNITQEDFIKACKTFDAVFLKRIQESVMEEEFLKFCNFKLESERNILHWIALEAHCENHHHKADEIAFSISNAAPKILCDADIHGKTPLHYATSTNHICLAKIFIRHHAPLNKFDRNLETVLEIAIKKNNVEFVQCLLDNGASFDRVISKINTNVYNIDNIMRVISQHDKHLMILLDKARESFINNISFIERISPIFVCPLMEGPEYCFTFRNDFQRTMACDEITMLAVFCCSLGKYRNEWKAQCFPRLAMAEIPLVNDEEVFMGAHTSAMMFSCSLKVGQNKIKLKLGPESVKVHEYVLASYVFLGKSIDYID